MLKAAWKTIATLAAVIAGAGSALAQSAWQPTRNIEFVVPYAVGGGADVFARIMAQVMVEEKMVPVPVQVVNHPGGGSAVGIAYVVANRAANPHTLVLVNNPTLATPLTVPNAPGLKNLQPLYNFMIDDFLVLVRADAPWKSATELVEAAKKAPGSIKAGAGGPTGGEATNQEAFSRAAGIQLNRITFNSGGEVLTALLGGHVELAVGNPIEYMGHLKSGAVRAIGALRNERYPELPDVPTLKEMGINAEPLQIWRGVAVPKGIPKEALAYWEGVMDKVAASSSIKKYLKENLAVERPMKGQEFATFLEDQEKRYREFLGK
jgi:putative tricarboxylic transport membrane protein